MEYCSQHLGQPFREPGDGGPRGGAAVLVPDRGSLSEQGLVNCLDPRSCYSHRDIHVWEVGEGPLLGPATP